jgi:hypothetical protein
MDLLESFMKTQAQTTDLPNAWLTLESTALDLGIELPPIDPVLKEKLHGFSPSLYATEESVTETTILKLIEAVEQKEVPDYCLFKFEEHGMASNILHFCMVHETLAIFLSLPYGGIEKEIQALQLTAANSTFRLLKNIKNQIKTNTHKLKPKQRLLIVENKRHSGNNGWGWVQPGQKLEWHTSRTPIVDLLTQGQLFS